LATHTSRRWPGKPSNWRSSWPSAPARAAAGGPDPPRRARPAGAADRRHLKLTLASANSALQRARVTMREHLPEGRLDWRVSAGQGLNRDERRLVAAYVRAHEISTSTAWERCSVDLRFAMPPQPGVWVGAYETIKGLGGRRLRRGRRYRLECRTRSPTGQSALAMYPRRPEASVYEAFMDVLRVETASSPRS
jgi:hypothetical protein